jgi:2-oxoglutarate dehydrogenase E1 component
VALAFNPSHLEIVGPVVQGSVRAPGTASRPARNRVLPVVIHRRRRVCRPGRGDGDVQHVAVARLLDQGHGAHCAQHQIGFTTSHQQDARSTLYCSDIAKVVGAPIFHVNGDDPEAVLFVTQIAFDYRMTFHKDVVIDLYCYRRHGHSEADEPTVTQPLMYQRIRALPTTLALYTQRLAQARIATADEAAEVGGNISSNWNPAPAPRRVSCRGKAEYAYSTDWSPLCGRAL